MNKRQKEVEKFKLLQEKTVLNRLKRQFDMSEKQIAEKIRKLQKQIEDLTDKMKNADPQEALLIKSQIMAKVYQRDYQQQLKSQIDKFVDAANDAKNRTVEGYLNECYQTGFAGSMYDLQGQGIPVVMPIDKKDTERALKLNAKVSNRLYGGYMTLMKKQIQSEISRGLIQALSYSEMARNLHNVTNAGFNNTMRIVRTEGHRIQIQSALDACDKAKRAGADIVKQWDATLDGATRETHRELDGKIAELDENFKYSGGEVSAPGMFGNPAEDCNCRCCILQRATWELDESELKELKNRAEYYGLDKTKDFEDYKKKYLSVAYQRGDSVQKNEKLLEKSLKSSTIKLRLNLFDKTDPLYLDAFSIEEEEGFEDVCLHGSADAVQKTINGTLRNFTPKEFAEYLRENGYKGGDIRLASCSTGKGKNSFAQQLSKELSVRVKAPTDDVYYAPDEGALFVGSEYKNTGTWRVFNNGEEE